MALSWFLLMRSCGRHGCRLPGRAPLQKPCECLRHSVELAVGRVRLSGVGGAHGRWQFWSLLSSAHWLLKDFIGGGRKKGEQHPCVVTPSRAPHWGPGPQPRPVPCLGIELGTLWLIGRRASTKPHQPGLVLMAFISPLSPCVSRDLGDSAAHKQQRRPARCHLYLEGMSM